MVGQGKDLEHTELCGSINYLIIYKTLFLEFNCKKQLEQSHENQLLGANVITHAINPWTPICPMNDIKLGVSL